MEIRQKNIDNSILFLVAMKDRTMRIEVGYGFEGPLNDAISKRIISDIVTPYFKQGQYFEGISKGVDQIIKTIKGDPLTADSNLEKSQEELSLILFFTAVITLFVSSLCWSIFGDAHNRKKYIAYTISIIATIIVFIITSSSLTLYVQDWYHL